MSVDILGTNCDQCRSMVQCCLTFTETVIRLSRYEKPRTATSTFTQLLNSDLCSDCTPGVLSYSLRCVNCKGGSYACSCWQSLCEHGDRQVSMSHVFLKTFLSPWNCFLDSSSASSRTNCCERNQNDLCIAVVATGPVGLTEPN